MSGANDNVQTAASPSRERGQPAEPLVVVENLTKYFVGRGAGRSKTVIKAVDGVDLAVRRGETIGVVGESGCGKTTTGRMMLRLIEPTAGTVTFDGVELTSLRTAELRRLRRRMQIIFQDPYASLNPRWTVADIIGRPMKLHGLAKGSQLRERVAESLERVGLQPHHASRYPHELSGGQRQRVGIARSLAVGPDLVICDEAVSALDVSTQSQVLNLLLRLQHELHLTYVFISHDLSVVKYVSDRIAVMYLGKLVELANAEELFRNPQHPYTEALFSAIPVPDPVVERRREHIVLHGDLPSPANPPSGCRFHTRCPLAMPLCREQEPVLRELAPDHWVACHATPRDVASVL